MALVVVVRIRGSMYIWSFCLRTVIFVWGKYKYIDLCVKMYVTAENRVARSKINFQISHSRLDRAAVKVWNVWYSSLSAIMLFCRNKTCESAMLCPLTLASNGQLVAPVITLQTHTQCTNVHIETRYTEFVMSFLNIKSTPMCVIVLVMVETQWSAQNIYTIFDQRSSINRRVNRNTNVWQYI